MIETCPHTFIRSKSPDGRCLICDAAEERIAAQSENAPPLYDPAVLLRAVSAQRCRLSLALFIQRGWHVLHGGTKLYWNWHMQAVADAVQALFEEVAKAKADEDYVMAAQRLLVNIPPRSAKSMIVSVFAPAWAWTRWPWLKIRCLSGNPRVTNDNSRFSRDLIASEWYQETFIATLPEEKRWQVRDDTDAIGLFSTTMRGERRSSTWLQKITGEGSDVIIADDPHDVEEAQSEKQRTAVTKKWDSTIGNRVNDVQRCAFIGIMQRVHQDDWTGHVLKQGKWQHVCFPMEFDPKRRCHIKIGDFEFTDPRTEPGALLQPERFPESFLAEEKIRLGSYGYAGQHQQLPAPDDGGQFQWKYWRFWKPDGVKSEEAWPRPERCYKGPAVAIPARFDETIITADCAFRETATSDRVAVFVIARIGANRYILDRRVARMDFGKTKAAIRELAKLYPLAIAKLIEGKANGDAVVNDLTAEIVGMIAVDPEGGKQARAAVLQPSVEAGNWFLPDGADWLEDFIGEFAIFPNGSNDDQVDAVSQAAIRFQTSPNAARAGMLCAM